MAEVVKFGESGKIWPIWSRWQRERERERERLRYRSSPLGGIKRDIIEWERKKLVTFADLIMTGRQTGRGRDSRKNRFAADSV